MGLSVCLCDLVLSCLQQLLVQRDLNAYCNRQILRKAASIPACLGRVLAVEFSLLPSGRRYALPAYKTNCHSKSFIPSAVRFLNSLYVLYACTLYDLCCLQYCAFNQPLAFYFLYSGYLAPGVLAWLYVVEAVECFCWGLLFVYLCLCCS